jgi:hypothetical protein
MPTQPSPAAAATPPHRDIAAELACNGLTFTLPGVEHATRPLDALRVAVTLDELIRRLDRCWNELPMTARLEIDPTLDTARAVLSDYASRGTR